MDIKITDKIYKLYVIDIDADSYQERVSFNELIYYVRKCDDLYIS